MSETFTCSRCQFTWQTGQSGSHDCAGRMYQQLTELREALAQNVSEGVVFLTGSGKYLRVGERSSFAPGGASPYAQEVTEISDATIFANANKVRRDDEVGRECRKFYPLIAIRVQITRNYKIVGQGE